ncbi:hypothetical protein B566_EDAN008648 [Ephemera danica]|nr:hypothetical protein B566_EDAN008648 [Ephemera danica]
MCSVHCIIYGETMGFSTVYRDEKEITKSLTFDAHRMQPGMPGYGTIIQTIPIFDTSRKFRLVKPTPDIVVELLQAHKANKDLLFGQQSCVVTATVSIHLGLRQTSYFDKKVGGGGLWVIAKVGAMVCGGFIVALAYLVAATAARC